MVENKIKQFKCFYNSLPLIYNYGETTRAHESHRLN